MSTDCSGHVELPIRPTTHPPPWVGRDTVAAYAASICAESVTNRPQALRVPPAAAESAERSATVVNVVNEIAAEPLTVANRLRPVLLKLARELRREVHPLGVTGGQVSLLAQIRAHPGIGARELAALERVSPAAMSGHVHRLERAGLVARTTTPGDRRRQTLALTSEAESVLRAVRSRRTAWLAERLRGLPEEDLAAVDRALEPLLRLLEPEPEAEPEPSPEAGPDPAPNPEPPR